MNKSFYDFDLFAAPDRDQSIKMVRGEGRSQVAIVYQTGKLPKADHEYLSTILKPLQMDLEKDTIYIPIRAHASVALTPLMKQYKIKHVLIFGCSTAHCGLRYNMSAYQLYTHQGRQFLYADTLEKIRIDRENNDKRKAAALWKSLQQMFPERAGR